jgi:hypothetical protein
MVFSAQCVLMVGHATVEYIMDKMDFETASGTKDWQISL